MNGRMIPIAVTIMMTAGAPSPSAGPPPSPAAVERLTAATPQPLPRPNAHTARRAVIVNYAELRCLALNIYWEARGQPERGQLAVAYVTLNRSRSGGFPSTLCGVVHESCQFGWTCDGRSDQPTDPAAWRDAQRIAGRALAGAPDPTNGALYFHHLREKPQWARGRYGRRVVIGDHVFFTLASAPGRVTGPRLSKS